MASFKLFKGWFILILTGLVIIAAVVLVALQWWKTADLTLYGKDVTSTTLVLMLLSAVGGVVMVWLAKAFFYGLRIIRQSKPQRLDFMPIPEEDE